MGGGKKGKRGMTGGRGGGGEGGREVWTQPKEHTSVWDHSKDNSLLHKRLKNYSIYLLCFKTVRKVPKRHFGSFSIKEMSLPLSTSLLPKNVTIYVQYYNVNVQYMSMSVMYNSPRMCQGAGVVQCLCIWLGSM